MLPGDHLLTNIYQALEERTLEHEGWEWDRDIKSWGWFPMKVRISLRDIISRKKLEKWGLEWGENTILWMARDRGGG